MFAVLRQRNFAYLWIGQIVSLIGDWVLFITLPFYIYSLTGSTFATGIMFIVQTIPRLFFGSIAGVFVDRWNRKYTMLITNLIQATVLLSLFLVRSQDLVWIIYLFAFVENTVSQFFIPAKTAIIPQIVDEQHLLAANSLNSTSEGLTRLVGPVLGGLLFGFFGLNSVVITDTISFFFAAVMVALIVLPPRTINAEQQETSVNTTVGAKASLALIGREWLAGIRLVRQDRLVVAIFTVMGVAMIGEGLVDVVLTGYVKSVLHGDALVLGWLMSAQAVGGIIGSLLIVRLSKRFSPALLIPLSGLVVGCMIAAIAVFPVLAVVLPLMTLIGLSAVGFFVLQFTLLQSSIANEYQGRIFGTLNALQAIAMLLGMGLASGLGDTIGIVPLVILDGGCNILAALLAFVLIRSALRTTTTVAANESTGVEIPITESLPQEVLTV